MKQWEVRKATETEPGTYVVGEDTPVVVFDTEKEAGDYCDMIDPDAVWIISPTE